VRVVLNEMEVWHDFGDKCFILRRMSGRGMAGKFSHGLWKVMILMALDSTMQCK
jgi:hypothetical protein